LIEHTEGRLLFLEQQFNTAKELLGEERFNTEFKYMKETVVNAKDVVDKLIKYNKDASEAIKIYYEKVGNSTEAIEKAKTAIGGKDGLNTFLDELEIKSGDAAKSLENLGDTLTDMINNLWASF
jgi:hypothetical protein